MSIFDGLDPAIANALRRRQERYGRNFEGPLPAPGVTYPHVLGMGMDERQLMGGGGGGGAWSPDPWAPAHVPPKQFIDFMNMMSQVHKATPYVAKLTPMQKRVDAVTQAHRNAMEHLQRIQHQRRANGPYR